MPVHVWVLAVVAVARLVRLVNVDVLLEPVRAWVERTAGPDSRRAYLMTCPWCASIWIAAAVMPAAYAVAGTSYTWVEVVFSILAASYAAGLADKYTED